MIGQSISHYKILEKSRPELCSGRGSSFRSASGTGLGEGARSDLFSLGVVLYVTLDRITLHSDRTPKVRKDELSPGDWVIIRTVRSDYRLKVLEGGTYEVRGGWFDRRGCAPMTLGIAGATWGGSAIMPQVLAACGMRVEFRNRLITSPVKSITVFPGRLMN